MTVTRMVCRRSTASESVAPYGASYRSVLLNERSQPLVFARPRNLVSEGVESELSRLGAHVVVGFIQSVHNFLSFLIQLALSIIYMLCSPNAAGLGCVDKDIVLLQLLDIALDLVHLFGETVHAILLAHGVEGHLVVGLLLELFVEGLPLLLES